MIYLCVDGGQTKTDVFLLNEGGTPLESWKEDQLVHPSRPGGERRLRGVVRRACEELKRLLEQRSLDVPLSMCFSLTGYHEGDEHIADLVREEVQTVFPGFEKAYTIPDYVGNWFAATGGKAGIVVIAGGGAVAYGRNDRGASIRIGGWGHILGDEGSGYWIGLEAVKAALKSRHGLIEKTDLAGEIMQNFGVDKETDFLRRVYSGSIDEDDFAALVPLVATLAQAGDGAANRILDEAAGHLAKMGAAIMEGLGTLPIHLSGGVFLAPTMRERFGKYLACMGKTVEIATESAEPANGILLAAKREAG